MNKDELLKKTKASTELGEMAKKMKDEQNQHQIKDTTALTKSINRNIIPPKAYKIPELKIPPAEVQNHYQSASKFMESLAKEALEWKQCVGEDYTPAIIAILYGGIQVNVNTLSQVSFHGIRIEGLLNGAPCTILAHQSTVQMLCHAVKIEPEIPSRPIGFIWEDNEVEV